MKTYRLTIVTPERVVFDADVQSLVAPGGAGSLGVLADHAPLLTTLAPGRLEFTDPAGMKKTVQLSGGFLSVVKNKVTLLADSVEIGES